MASYRVTLWNDTEPSNLVDTRQCRSRPYALHVARQFAYNKLEAFGKLDTEAAHAIMARIDSLDDIWPKGTEQFINLSNTEHSIIISRRE